MAPETDQPPINSRARVRELERHGTASIRALSRSLDAEYRARRLKVGGASVPYATPYLTADFSDISLSRSRGIADALAARLTFSDSAIHKRYAPTGGIARVVFDILEQIRSESQVPSTQLGVRQNLNCAFEDWCQESRANGLVESNIGILLYTIIHMVRARLIRNADDEEVEALIEATRANLSPIIGKPFYLLSKTRDSQIDYAQHALEIALILSGMIDDDEEEASSSSVSQVKHVIALGPDWDGDDLEGSADGAGGIGGGSISTTEEYLDTVGDYQVFDRQFDQIVSGDSLYRSTQLQALRTELDKQVAGQAVSVTRLALRLQGLFATPETDGWVFGQDEGVLDGRRLSQLIGNPDYRQVFRRDRLQPVCDTVVSFLVDTSGSMKSQRYETVAVLIDTYARALELAGVKTEILGFTTGDWNGGRVMKAWRQAGMPENPGRLNETLHIVYKDADLAWKRSRHSIAAMMKTHHFREGVDGEALIWAYRRLKNRQESRKVLVVVSDGAPLDAATHNANRPGFLTDHLRSVAGFLEGGREIEVGAIGIDLDLSDLYRHSLNLDLTGTLNTRSYAVLESLFGRY